MKNNPWKGLLSYEEKDLENYEFCGRTKTISKYYTLITNNLFSTLYGKSGTGKTSLLQAGIFPLLRQDSYFPVMCRLSLRNENISFADYLIKRVEQEIDNLGFSCTDSVVSVNQIDDLEKYRLWKYFYGHKFYGKDDNEVFPVIVLDQFEEVLINSKDASLKFLKQVGFLIGDDLLLPDDCYANFRVTISLREDFLYLLEDAIDEETLSGLRDNRMRLSPLSIEEAVEIISLGDEFIDETDRKEIYKSICALSQNRRKYISTNILSLICSQIYQIYSEKHEKLLITMEDIQLLSKDPLGKFYRNCSKDLKDETIAFIENNLVLKDFRRPVTKLEFEKKVSEVDRKKLTIGDTKILQFITANDTDCVELIHDTLAQAVHRIAMSKKKISISQKIRIFLEFILCIIISLGSIFESIVNNIQQIGVVICGVLFVIANLYYSIAIYGNKRVSKIHYLFLWSGYFIIYGLEYFGPLHGAMIMYLFINPIINILKQNSHSEILGFWDSFKYVFSGETVREDDKKIAPLLSLLSVILVIGVGVLSGFFMSSWTLWILLPIGTSICYYNISHIIGKSSTPGSLFHYIYPVVLSLGFVIVQHIATCHIILTCIVLLLYLIWSVISAIRQKEIMLVRKIIYAFSIFILCGLILPIFYLGYNPLSKDFRNIARNWNQPKVNTSMQVPLLTIHDEESQNGLADRHQIIFDTKFLDIDSVTYEYYDWKELLDLWDYRLLSIYYDDKDKDKIQNKIDIILHTKTGAFRWKDMFAYRGDSKYLTTRLDTLEKNFCAKWTEEEFQNIAELAAGYRIIGCDSLANTLEVLYFLRRMIQTEIYHYLGDVFTQDEILCENTLDYYLHKRVDENFRGDYTDRFIKKVDTCVSLQVRINNYLDIADGGFMEEYTQIDDSELFKSAGIKTVLGDLAKTNAEEFLKILNSYKKNVIPFKSLDMNEDMMYQTRNTWGRYVVDSIFIAVYEDSLYNDVKYNNACSWYNLFLCRFANAEKYARRACAAKVYNIPDEVTRYLPYTNLINSLFLQGKTTEAFDLVHKMKDYPIVNIVESLSPYLFPIQSGGYEMSVGDGVIQDFNHFIRAGILKDSTTTEFRKIRNLINKNFLFEGHYTYPNGWNLSIKDSLYFFYKDDQECLPLIKSYDINIKDSVAICHMATGGYRFLDLSNMQFIGEIYNYAWHFSEGLAGVVVGDTIGFINKLGQLEIAPQYPSESWLQKDHYRLAFHNGRAIVMKKNLYYYNAINRDGIWLEWTSYPYLKSYETGFVGKSSLSSKLWFFANVEGFFKGKFDAELDDLLIHPEIPALIPIYNHFDISEIKYAEEVPELDISGIWDGDHSYVYFSKYNSQYMRIGERNNSGFYYLSVDDNNIKVHMCSDTIITKNIIKIDSKKILMDTDRYIKLRDL